MVKINVHNRKELFLCRLLFIISILSFIYGIFICKKVTKFETPFSLYIFMLLFIVFSLYCGYLLLRSITTYIYLNDQEMVVRSFNIEKHRIKWSEIKEIGIGEIYTPNGKSFRLFFSKEPLTYQEIDNLDLADHKCFYLQVLNEEAYNLIQKHCPIETPQYIHKWKI